MSALHEICADDPKLTAYAVGELNETEREEFEQQLARSPELRREIEEIRVMATALRSELGAQAFHLQDSGDRRTNTENILPFPRRRFVAIAISTMAASIALVVAWQFGIAPSPNKTSSKVISLRPTEAAGTRGVDDPQSAAVFRDLAHVAYNAPRLDLDVLGADAGLSIDLFRPGRLSRHYDLSAHSAGNATEAGFHFIVRYGREFSF